MPQRADTEGFFSWFRSASENQWQHARIETEVFGFQIQPGTRWLPGLTDSDIASFETEVGFGFPAVYRDYLRHMNGTDLPAVNTYGGSGTPYTQGPAFYSFPRDLGVICAQIQWIYDEFGVTPDLVAQNSIPHIVPVIGHRFLVVDRCRANPILSMYGTDVSVYASSLPQFLHDHVFHGGIPSETTALESEVPFWLDEDTPTAPPN